MTACDAGEVAHFRIDLILEGDEPDTGFWVYVRDLDGACCLPETPWPDVGECSQSTDYANCSCTPAFGCLRQLRVEQGGAVIGTVDLSPTGSSGELGWYAAPIAAGEPGEFVIEGCGQTVRIPFTAPTLAKPSITSATRNAGGADLAWTLPPGAATTVYRWTPDASFVSDFCHTDRTAARVASLPERRVDIDVVALATPQETATSLGTVRIWNTASASVSLDPVPAP